MLAPESTLNDRYRITYVADDRSDGVIYRAIDNQSSLRVLIAELPQPNEATRDDVAHLAAQLSGLSAPGLLTLRDHFALGLNYYLVADDPGGQDLERVARDRGGPMSEQEVLTLVDRLLGALDVLHSRVPPITVGDLRSSDLWSSVDGGLFLAPFALVRHLGTDASPYRAPELNDTKAEPTTASDVYALGAVLYQLLTGWAPPPAAQRVAGAPLNSPRVLNARVSALAEQLALRSLELKAVNRYQQAREMRSAVETVRLMAGRPLGATAPVESYGQTQPLTPQGQPSAPGVGASVPLPPRPIAPGAEPAPGYGPPPPAPPPGWTSGNTGMPSVQGPQWGAQQPPAPGWTAGSPPAPAAPPRRRGVSNSCLIALVAGLAVLAVVICITGLGLLWFINQNAGSLPFLPGAAATMATAGPAAGTTAPAAPATGQGGQPAAGAALSQATTYTQTKQLADPSVGSAVYAPDGRTVAVGVGGDIQIRDSQSLDSSKTLSGHSNEVQAIVFSPDGSTLASSAQDENSIRLWNVGTGQETRRLEGHSGWIRSLAFSPDGRTLASGSVDRTIVLWDVASGRQLRTLEGHTDWLGNVAFSPDGTLLASASRDGTARLWDVATGQPRSGFSFASPTNPETNAPFWLTGISFSPDSSELAVGSASGSVYILNATTGRQQRELQGHTGWVVIRGVSFSPNGDLLASAGIDGTVHIWNPATGADRGTLRQRGLRLLSLSWSPDGERVITSSDTAGTLAIWDVQRQEVVQSAIISQGAITALAYSADGALLSSGGANGSVKIHILADGRTVSLSGGARTNQYMAFVSDTQLAAVSDGGDVVVINLAGQTDVEQLQGLDGVALTVAVSRDGRTIAAGNERGDIALWDASTLQESRTLSGLGGPVYALAFNGDGSRLAAVTNEPPERPRVIIWDVQSGDRTATYSGHSAQITAVALPNGQDLAATTSTDGTIKIWQASTGDELRSIAAPAEQGWYQSIAFSPDGSLLVTGSLAGDVEFWNPATGERVGGFNLAAGSIFALSFSPDGEQIAVATRDSGVYLLEPKP